MAVVDLRYGRGTLPIQYDDSRFEILASSAAPAALTDAQINARLDTPIGSPPIEDLIAPGESVLLVVPDATRQTASGQIVNLLVRRLIANGTAPHEIAVIFATGIHRKATSAEKAEILTPFIFQRIKTLDHEPRGLSDLVRVGETSTGVPVELNRVLVETDHVVLVGGVTFHYFAGFTGGRKLVCPGLAASRTISATHRLAFDCEKMSRRDGVGTARLDGNAVHEAFVQAASMANPRFAISAIVNDAGEAVDVFCGDWLGSHRTACDAYAASHTVTITEKRDTVVVSCGGSPFDINMIQAHKSLDAASHACREGGTIILLAECPDGLGRSDMARWFDAGNSDELGARLCEKYQVNGQTAWSILQKAERFDIRIVTSLSDSLTTLMSLTKIPEAEDLKGSGYIIPKGASLRIIPTFEDTQR